jgi:hypothetical protein
VTPQREPAAIRARMALWFFICIDDGAFRPKIAHMFDF